MIGVHFHVLYLEAALFHPGQHCLASDERWSGAGSLRHEDRHLPYAVPRIIGFVNKWTRHGCDGSPVLCILCAEIPCAAASHGMPG